MSKVAASIAKKIVVFGGNGFLGKRICQTAINRGFEVTSVSGSGRKPKLILNEDCGWIDKVKWTKGDVFNPETYEKELEDTKAVVHSIGILLENDNYKKVVSSNDGLFNTVESFFKTSNPMKKTPDVTGQVVIDKTYERINTESALVLAETLIEVNKSKPPPSFVYISADRGFPGIPMGYIESKRRTEYELYQLQPNIRPVFLRPGFMFDPNEKNASGMRSKIKGVLEGLNVLNEKLLYHMLDGIIRPPISTNVVAEWCIDKIEDDDFHGPVMLDEMINITKN